MRAVLVAVAAALVLSIVACTSQVARPSAVTLRAEPTETPRADSAATSSREPEPPAASTDALLAAASHAGTARPVRIVGYELVLWQNGTLDFEVFMTKEGEFLAPERMWGAGPEFPSLGERPPARIKPASRAEWDAQERAIARALAQSVAHGWGSDEAMVRIYLLEDAKGSRFLMSPDGLVIRKAPRLVPWG